MGIWDFTLRAFCSLGDAKPLQWGSARGADAWLLRCYHRWGACPQRNEEPPPAKRWGTRRLGWTAGRSPWEDFVTPLEDSRFGR